MTDLARLRARVEAVPLPDRYPDGVGEFDYWTGYRVKLNSGEPGVIVEPEEGGGRLPVTFLSLEKAAADLETLAVTVMRLDQDAPGSYLAEVVQGLAEELREALRRLLDRMSAP